jgi:simple sugar transport system ATP-binding protein
MLHQDPLDFPPMQVIENFVLGQKGRMVLSYKERIKEFQTFQTRFGFSLDPRAYVDSLTVGERQQLEILRLLWLGVKVLILDEPTTGISAQQKDRLFKALKLLAGEGKTIIFVSHKLEDVESLCDEVVILRKGREIGKVSPPYKTDQLIEMMFGKQITLVTPDPVNMEKITLELKNLTVEKYPLRIEDVNLQLRAGEVVGLSGMEGSGQDILLRACVGLLRPVEGQVVINGTDLSHKNYLEFVKNKVSYLPASRMEEGLVPGITVAEHFTLTGNEERRLFIDKEQFRQKTQEKIDEYHIIGQPETPVESLSGGNQQRVALSLLKDSLNILLLEHPTRGLDIESAIYMWDKLKERCKQGTSIIFISADLEEILRYSDRVMVFFSGHVSEPLDARQTSLEQLGQLIGGKGWESDVIKEEPYELSK